MKNYELFFIKHLNYITDRKPIAVAELKSSDLCSQIHGGIYFYQAASNQGLLIVSAFFGLPENMWYDLFIYDPCYSSGRTYTRDRPQISRNGIYDPKTLIGIYGNDGCAFSACYSEAFDKAYLVGRSLFLRKRPSVSKENNEPLACGLIMPVS
jgi:hypothetical protein